MRRRFHRRRRRREISWRARTLRRNAGAALIVLLLLLVDLVLFGPVAAAKAARFGALFAVLGFIVWSVITREMESARKEFWQPGRCSRCGYDLRKTRYRCPECGDTWLMRR